MSQLFEMCPHNHQLIKKKNTMYIEKMQSDLYVNSSVCLGGENVIGVVMCICVYHCVYAHVCLHLSVYACKHTCEHLCVCEHT